MTKTLENIRDWAFAIFLGAVFGLMVYKHWALPIGLAFSLILILFVLRFPYFAIVMPFYGVFFTRSLHVAAGINYNLLSWFLLVVFYAFAVLVILHRRPNIIDFTPNAAVWISTVFLCIYIMYALLAKYPVPWSYKAVGHLIILDFIPLIVLTMILTDHNEFEKIALAYIATITVIILISIFKYRVVAPSFLQRFNLVQGPPTSYGRSLAVGGIFSIWFFNRYKKVLIKAFAIFVFAGCIYFLLKTGTRGSLGGFIIGFVIYFLLLKIPWWKKILAALVFAGIIIVYFKSGVAATMVMRIKSAIKGLEVATITRIYLYKIAIEHIKQSPWIGVGVGGYHNLVTHLLYYNYYPHNMPLEVWVELGIIGLITYASLVILTLVRGVKIVINYLRTANPKYEMGLLLFVLFIFGLAVSQISGNIPWNYHFWYSLALVNAYYVLIRRETKNARVQNG